MGNRPCVLVEPFAGGGIISLTALFENLADKVVMVELDDEIAAVWQSVINGDAKWLADRILIFELSRESVIKEIKRRPRNVKEKAFQTILKNRTFHGGILAEGSGLLKHGENGKGIRSRWYPATLAKRLLALDEVANRIEFRHGDGLQAMKEFSSRDGSVFFIDPPYTAGGKKAGKRLYRFYELDHETLFHVASSLKGDFLMTYDRAEEVAALVRKHGFDMRLIPMSNTHHARMEELVIGRDLSWLAGLPVVREPGSRYGSVKSRRKN